MKTLYFDCSSGISGDMTVAALLDLGADEKKLSAVLDLLALPGYEVSHFDCMKNGIRARRFSVSLTRHEHHHRTLRDIFDIFGHSSLPTETRELAEKIFLMIARAEGKIHGKAVEDVHFHEVGAVDSIVDVVAAAECIRQLAPDCVVFSNIREGCGSIACAHGTIPIPAPATLEILKDAGAVLSCTDNLGEMVTPTGAGIAAAIGDAFGSPIPEGVIAGIGYGAGARDFSHPNILRVVLLEDTADSGSQISVLEAGVDDMTGEQLGFALERFLDAGALDAYFTPIYMKKNRPATLVTILCRTTDEEQIGRLLLKHTTTLGYRIRHSTRCVMHREMFEVATPYGSIPVKRAIFGDIVKYHPEFDAVCDAARRANVEVTKVLASVNLQLAQLASCNSPNLIV